MLAFVLKNIQKHPSLVGGAKSMIGIDYSIRINEQQTMLEQLKSSQLFQIVPIEEIGIQPKELIAFAKNTIKNVDRYDEITDILVKAIKRRRPNTTQEEAMNIVLDFDL